METDIGPTPQDITEEANFELAIRLQKENRELKAEVAELTKLVKELKQLRTRGI